MILYRVEHADTRRGPYIGHHPDLADMLCRHDSNPCRYPTLREDDIPAQFRGLDDWSGDRRFGFSSIESLQSWFDLNERGMLAKLGYTIGVYRVPMKHVIPGRRQCNALYSMMKHQRDIPLT